MNELLLKISDSNNQVSTKTIKARQYLSREQARQMPFYEYFVRFVWTYKKGKVKDVTLQKYILHAKFIASRVPEIKLADLDGSRSNVQLLLDTFGKEHRKNSTLDFKASVIHSLKYARDDGFIDRLVSDGLAINSVERTWTQEKRVRVREQPKFLQADEFEQLRNYLDERLNELLAQTPKILKGSRATKLDFQTEYILISIACHTGARYAEILGITFRDVLDNSIKIDKTWNYRANVGGFKDTKNIYSIRNVQVDKTIIRQIRKYWAWKNQFINADPKMPLWYQDDLNMCNSTLNKILRRTQKKLGINKNISLHKLRHTYVSYLLANDIDERFIARQVGHADVNMIHRIYGHLLKEKADSETKRIEQIMR